MAIPITPLSAVQNIVEGKAAVPIVLVQPSVDHNEIEAGAAIPVYYVSDAELENGRFRVEGRTEPILAFVVTDGRVVRAGASLPVYVMADAGIGGAIPPIPPLHGDSLLLEDGSGYLLLEIGDRLLIE